MELLLMTLTEFLLSLRNTPRDWELRNGHEIRRGRLPQQCPISSLGDLPASQWADVALQMDGDVSLADIALAADDKCEGRPLARLRLMLLWATEAA